MSTARGNRGMALAFVALILGGPRPATAGVTSILLNIAEGNGRYAELDHRRFLDIAEGSAVKVAAYLDLAVQKLTLDRKESSPGKALARKFHTV